MAKTSKARQDFRDNLFKNNNEMFTWYTLIKLIATSMFKWENLPNGITERFIENTLYRHGLLALYDDKFHGIILCRALESGRMNLYDEYTHYKLHSNSMYTKTVKKKDVILLRNNHLQIPTFYITRKYCEKMQKLDRAIDSNVDLQKYSGLIKCSEDQKRSYEQLLMKFEGNIPFIFTHSDLDTTALDTMNFNVPFIAPDLQKMKGDTWRELMSNLGINNANTEKKERLNSDEVNSNNDYLRLVTDVFLNTREKFCEELNERYGENTTVSRRNMEEIMQSVGTIGGGILEQL